MNPSEELAFLRRRVYDLTYTEDAAREHGAHCLIPAPNVNIFCPICVGNGWLPNAEPEHRPRKSVSS